MANLSIKIQGEELDLFENEKVVQTFTIINVDDILKLQSEYSNTFNIPATNKNIRLCDYSNYINSNTRFPYSKVNCEIYIDEFLYKKGFIQLLSIDDKISIRFFTGNAGFYEALKSKKLPDVDVNLTPSLLTTWNLFNVVNGRAQTSGAFFPLIDYNGMPTTGNVVDVRRLLPAYYKHTLMNSCCIDNGYTLDNQITGNRLAAYNKDIVPTAKSKLENDASTISENSYSGDMILGSNDLVPRTNFSNFGYDDAYSDILTGSASPVYFGYSNLLTGNPANYIDVAGNNDYFLCSLSGTYDFTWDLNLQLKSYARFSSTPFFEWQTHVQVTIYVNGVNRYSIGSQSNYTPNGNTLAFPASFDTNVNFASSTTLALNAGDVVYIGTTSQSDWHFGNFVGFIDWESWATTQFTVGDSVSIQLSAGLTFGASLPPSICLPNMTMAEFFKDTCVRYGIIPIVNEDTKVVKFIEFSSVKDNIPNAVDWTDKIDETNPAVHTFEIGSYAQKNNIKHKEDKSVPNIPLGSDYVLGVDNQNLPYEKDLYVSPFAPSEMVTRLGTDTMIYINSHDGTFFNLSIESRTCYVRLINRTIDYYDGTTTTTVTTNIPLTWFIDSARDYSAGFLNSLSEFNLDLYNVVQTLKILTIDIKLNILDILNINYLYPIYLDNYNAYFFISQIKQFDYTSNDATEVELIKLT